MGKIKVTECGGIKGLKFSEMQEATLWKPITIMILKKPGLM